jgi:hypothetical protein
MNQGSFQKGYLRINAYEYKKKENLMVSSFVNSKRKKTGRQRRNLIGK